MIEQGLKTYTLHYPSGFAEQWTPQPGWKRASMLAVALELLEDAGVKVSIVLEETEEIMELVRLPGADDAGMSSSGAADPRLEPSEKEDLVMGKSTVEPSEEDTKEETDLTEDDDMTLHEALVHTEEISEKDIGNLEDVLPQG